MAKLIGYYSENMLKMKHSARLFVAEGQRYEQLLVDLGGTMASYVVL